MHGWADPEPSHTWAIGRETVFALPCQRAAADRQIEFHVLPFVATPAPAAQRMEVFVNGCQVGAEALHGPACLGFRLPGAVFGDADHLIVKLLCPDATAPALVGHSTDARRLTFMFKDVTVRAVKPTAPFQRRRRPPAFASRFTDSEADRAIVRGLTGLSTGELALQFESLGINCLFGLFQRRCGVEPLGLLRFAGLHYPDLVDGTASGFEGIGDIGGLSCSTEGPQAEWALRCDRYGVEFHTHKPSADVLADQLLAQQSRVLTFREAKFRDLLKTGEKLFVVHRPQGMTVAHALPLIEALRGFGPNALLFASDNTGRPAGSVEIVAPDLFCGSTDGVHANRDHLDTLPNDTWLGDLAFTAWLSICANAYRMWRETGHGPPDLAG